MNGVKSILLSSKSDISECSISEFLESVQTLSPKRSRNFSESSVSSSRCSSRLSGKAKTKKKAKRENVLHFLKRMLDDETNEIIVWKDKERGIFFIADRDGLLEAWKETKGRSASNWNNFALVQLHLYFIFPLILSTLSEKH